MYDELVKRLRYCADSDNQCSECKYSVGSPDGSKMCLDLLMVEAADAIEELSLVAESNERSAAQWAETAGKAVEQIPHWIPVSEEPPLKAGDDGYNGYLVYANGYYEVSDYAMDKLDNVPYFHVDGEWEPGVTHYMPLPQPPKEEE